MRYDATIGQHRREHRETFIPLAHDPGQRLEADFGHIYVDFPTGRQQVPVLIAVWSYSNYPFVQDPTKSLGHPRGQAVPPVRRVGPNHL
jgi:hypothetical protein